MDSDSEQLQLVQNLNFIKEIVPDNKKTKIKIGNEEIVVDTYQKKSIQQLDAQIYFQKTNNSSKKQNLIQEHFQEQQLDEKEQPKKYRKVASHTKQQKKQFQVYNIKYKKPFPKKKIHLNLQDNYVKASPEQIFYYSGVKINVIYASYLKTSAHTLVIPFRSETEWVSLFASKIIADKMKQSLYRSDYAKNKKYNLIKSEDIFYNKNYTWTMLYNCDLGRNKEQKPSTLLKDYLKDMLQEIIKLNIQSIIIPKFRWCQSLSNMEKAKIIFDLILSYLRVSTTFGPCPIKQISFCINEIEEYFCFVEAARKISDQLIRHGGIMP